MSELTRQDANGNNNTNNSGMHQNGYLSVISPMYGHDIPMFAIPPPTAQYVQPTQYNMHTQTNKDFWMRQIHEISVMEHVKQHDLPLARIKKIVKSDEDVRNRGQVCSIHDVHHARSF